MCNAEKPNYKKMKVLIFAVLVVSLTIGKKTFSQVYFPFPDSNAAWNTVGHNIFSGYQWNFRYAVYGDTVINSIEYHKVYEMFDSTDSDEVLSLLRNFHQTQSKDDGNALVASLDSMLDRHAESLLEEE